MLPLLYLHGLSTGDFVPALEEFFGSAAGLSASAVGRLTTDWQDEQRTFAQRDLSTVDYVYVWVDGVHFTVRLDEARLCTLVIVGVRTDGTKELVAVADGHRESTESWADLLRDCRRRGMRAPVLAVGDGALGFWAALREVFPTTREQRCWVHKAANVIKCLPKSAQPANRRAIAEIRDAEDRGHAEVAIGQFRELFAAKYPKAVAKIVDDAEALLAFYDFPAEHWIHLKTTNPIWVHLRHRPATHQRHQGTRQPRRRAGDGLQAAGCRPAALAGGQRAAPGRARASRRDVPQGTARRASHRHHRQDPQESTEEGTKHGSGEGRCVIMQDTPIHNS